MGKIPLDECMNHCDLNQHCKSFSFHSANFACYLKDKEIDEKTPQKYKADWSTYYSVCLGN